MHRPLEDRHNAGEWRMIDRNREEVEWDERKWKSEIDKAVKVEGLSKYNNGMERKETLKWYREEALKHEMWYNGLTLG